MNNSLLEKRGYGFVRQSVRNKCAKFTLDPLSRFRTGARRVFTTQKLFPSEILLNHENCNIKFSLSTFSNQITIC